MIFCLIALLKLLLPAVAATQLPQGGITKGGAGGGPAVQTCWKQDDISSTASTITLSVSPAGGSGHILVAFARSASQAIALTNGFTDNSGSNTWNSVSRGTGTISGVGEGYVQGPASGTYTITATFTSSDGFRSITACEVSGVSTSSSLDSSSVTIGSCSTSATSCTTSTFSTANAHEFVIAFATVNSLSATFSAGTIGGSSATLLSPVANDTDGQYRSFTSTQSSITSVYNAGSSLSWDYIVAGFQAP